jgi:putative Mg2+ transporter-C (MgtC) family protein
MGDLEMNTKIETWTFLQSVYYFGPRIFFALFCGGLIGLERELKHKAAGLKTNMLICLGAMLYTCMSIIIAGSYAEVGHYGDPSRVAAQIVSGIGFLGGGAILQSRGSIVGLTTAATIWVVAAIGVCIGAGFWSLALFCSFGVVSGLYVTSVFKDRFIMHTEIKKRNIALSEQMTAAALTIHD